MSNLSIFDSAMHTLSKSNNLSDIQVKYIKSPKNISSKEIPIYKDDTCKEVLLKLSSLHSVTISEHIFAWYKIESSIIPLGFNYPSIELDFPFKNKDTLDNRFITEEGYRIIALIDKTHLHNLIEEYDIKTIFYTTIQDYLEYLGLNYKKTITDDICLQSTKFKCRDLYNGKLVKFWPSLTEEQIYTIVDVTKEKLKKQREIVDYMLHQSYMVYSASKIILPDEFNIQLLSLSNDDEDNIVHLTRLFSDIYLGDQTINLNIPFSKITLEDYTARYCKLLKDAISINIINEKNYITEKIFEKWSNNQITTISSANAKFLDEKNSVVFRLLGEGFTNTASLIIYSNGLTKLLLSGQSSFMSDNYVNNVTTVANKFIEYLNKCKIFSDKSIKLLDTNYENTLRYITIQYIYPIKNYKIEIMSQIIKNMKSFIRFNKIEGNKIYCIYTKINQYGKSISSVITSLKKYRQNLTADEIIKELEIIFNISHDEAIEEYENYESEKNIYFKSSDEGIEFIIDLIGTNVKVDVNGITGYNILGRIYHLLNFIMDYYENYIVSKKDPEQLLNKKENTLFDDINNEEIEQDLLIQSNVESVISDSSDDEILRLEEPDSSDLSDSGLSDRVLSDSGLSDIVLSDSDLAEVQQEPKSTPDVASQTNESSASSDFSMGHIDGGYKIGGYKQIGNYNQTGGYNVSRYYLNRLKKYDKDIFTKQSNIPRKNSYPVLCGAQYGRQPVAITKQMLDKYNETDEGDGSSFSKAINIPGRDPNTYYICPKYWDIKDEKPRSPNKIHEFKDFIVDNKMTTSQKQNTDNYVLVRDEGGYWEQSGDDINRYRIELLKGCHSNYDLPCCYTGSKKLVKGWEVDVLVQVNGKLKWVLGTVVSVSKDKVKVRHSDAVRIEEYPISNVRRHKTQNTLVSSFPLDIDTIGHIHPIIQNLIKQNNDDEKYSGLIRKGVFRANTYGDQSLLESFTEILNKQNVDILCKNIISDLKSLYKQNKTIIQSIANGDFINKFKMDIIDFPHNKAIQFLNYVKKIYPFVDTNIKRIQNALKNKNKKTLSPIELFIEILKKGSTNERLLLNNEINIFSSIIQFEKYINDKYELVTDEYIIPVLCIIAKYPSLTFTRVYHNLSIVVFEKINEDITISPPLGGFNNLSESMILLYKENIYSYEPILYRKWDTSVGKFIYTGIINYVDESVDETNGFYSENDKFRSILVIIQKKLDEYLNQNNIISKLIKLSDLEIIMKDNKLPIKAYIYDSYSKVVYIRTDKNVLIPVEPTGIKEYMNLLYLPSILKKDYPIYNDVIEIYNIIDRLSGKDYLLNISLSVVNVSKKSLQLVIKELILECGAYCPLKEELYDNKRFKEDVCIAESYSLIDKNIGLHENTYDKRVDYLNRNEYINSIQKLLFQKIFLMLKEKPKLFKDIHKIKYHPIMLRQHKSEKIYDLIDKEVRKLVSIDDKELDDLTIYEDKELILIRQCSDISGKEMSAELLYYKLVKLMIECMLNYSEKDYDGFLQLNINLSKLKSLLKENELLFSYQDIVNQYHLEYFIRVSKYIRNYIIYNSAVEESKLRQIAKKKQKYINSVKGEFTKEYPQILHRMFGRKIDLITYKKEDYSFMQVIHMILNELFDEEITLELIESVISSINKEGLDNLTEHFKNIGICCISKLQTKRLQHDILVSYHRKDSELPALVFYETETSIVHVKNRKGIFTIGDIPDK